MPGPQQGGGLVQRRRDVYAAVMEDAQVNRRRPGEVRDAILDYLRNCSREATVSQIRQGVAERIKGQLSESSVRSYLRLNVGSDLQRTGRGTYCLHGANGNQDAAQVSVEPKWV